MKKIMKLSFSKFVNALTVLTLVVAIVLPQVANALSMTVSKDTATRLKLSTTADHVITTTMPTAIAFDVAGTQDGFQFDFPATFSQGGTWQTADFTFSDSNGAHTVENVSAGAGTITCTSTTAENVCVAIDTTNLIFTVKPSTSYTTSSSASAVTFTIFGTTTTGTGTLTNPASVAATNIDFKMCDEQSGCFTTFVATHSSQIAYAIANEDQVSVTATVVSSITFDLDAGVADGENDGPHTVALGTIGTGDVESSGTTDSVNMIIAEGDTNASGGMVVTVRNANGADGLVSTSVPADDIDSSTGTMAAGTENYGLCVITVGLTGFTIAAPYSGNTCATNSNTNVIDALTTAGENILNSGGAPMSGGHAEISVNGAVSGTTSARSDYTDTLTFIATGTF